MATSSSSSSTGRCRRRVSLIRQPSREEHYEGPARYCGHGFLAPRWTSWSDGNPGQRFYSCRKYLQGGSCGYFAWHDEDFGERANVVIKELLDDIDKLYDENMKLRGGNLAGRLSEEVDAILCEVTKMKERNEINESEIRKGQIKYKFAMAMLFVTWVWMCILYMRI